MRHCTGLLNLQFRCCLNDTHWRLLAGIGQKNNQWTSKTINYHIPLQTLQPLSTLVPMVSFSFSLSKKRKKDQKESKKKRMKRHKTTEIHTRMRFFFKCEVKILSLPKNTNSVLNYSQSCSSTRHVFIFRR